MKGSESKIEFLITAGGTREPIDDVRYIGNESTGRLGAAVADRADTQGHKVRFIHAEGSCRPQCADKITLDSFRTSDDLNNVLERRVRAAALPAVVVHAAAVADFVPEKAEGKIPSSRDELVLRLKRNVKIVDRIKDWNPGIWLVKFKLESNRTMEQLLKIGLEAGRRSRADWIVANDIKAISLDRHKALVIDSGGRYLEAATKQEIASVLVEMIEGGPAPKEPHREES